MKIKEIISALEQFAPLPLQDSFDNAGLQVGLTDAEATGALLCLDVTEAVLDEALATGCNLVVSHHPLLFKGCKSLTGRTYVERCVIKAIRHGIAIYSAHTNMDNAPQGVNHKMALKLGLTALQVLEPKEQMLLKLAVYVPQSHAEAVRQALFAAGCGCIGRYDSCSFGTQGQGTFRPGEGTRPYLGRPHELSTVPEVRIETILPAYRQADALRAIHSAHPYEEPAYDLYPLQNTWAQTGAGVIGQLPEPEPETDFLARVKATFHVACLRHNALTGRPVRTVALCGGAGAFLMPQALRAKADVFITGEIKYHDYFGHDGEILLTEIGHYESEQYTQEIFHTIIREAFPALPVRHTTVDTNPIKYM